MVLDLHSTPRKSSASMRQHFFYTVANPLHLPPKLHALSILCKSRRQSSCPPATISKITLVEQGLGGLYAILIKELQWQPWSSVQYHKSVALKHNMKYSVLRVISNVPNIPTMSSPSLNCQELLTRLPFLPSSKSENPSPRFPLGSNATSSPYGQ